MTPEDSTEVFKQAVTATMRAISGDDELVVTFGRGKPYLQGSRARVPLPELQADDFPLDGLAVTLAGLRREILQGRGFVLLRGLPVSSGRRL